MHTDIHYSSRARILSLYLVVGLIVRSLMNRTPLYFSTETYNALFFEVRDQQYQLVANYRPVLNEKYHQILEVFDGFRQFNK